MFEYELIRSKRKTIAIQITSEGTVIVRAPNHVAVAEIEKLLQNRSEWVATNSAKRQLAWEQKANFTLSFGDTVTLLGREHTIVPCDGNCFDYDNEYIYLPKEHNTNEEIRKAIECIYRSIASEFLSQKVLAYANRMAVAPASIKISSAKTIWGSCSGENRLNFSWLLFFADSDIIEYVVVHELAHIRQHNHSEDFWNVVAEYCPNYKECEDGLKDLQQRLSKQAWL